MSSKKGINIADVRGKLYSQKTNGTNPFIEGANKICQIKEFKTDLRYEKPHKGILNVVSISLPSLKDAVAHENREAFPFKHRIYTYSPDYKSWLFDEFKRSLTFAVEKYNAHVICVNELGMPVNNRGIVDSKAINFAKQLADKHNCLIIAGSNHSRDKYTNVGYIFYPGTDDSNEKYKMFYKNVSAFQTPEPELLFTPSERVVHFTKAFGVGFSFLICLEIADFSSAAAIVSNTDNIDFLIVPAYLNTYGPMEKTALKISHALGGVLLNNCYMSKDLPISRLYLNGKIFGNDTNRKENPRSEPTRIVLRKVNVTEFLNTKDDNKFHMPDELKYLFNSKNRPV